MNQQEFRELSAAYAIDALETEDELRFVEALSAHPEWRWIVDEDRRTAAELAESVAPVTPPPSVKLTLFDAISAPTGTPSTGDPSTTRGADHARDQGADQAPDRRAEEADGDEDAEAESDERPSTRRRRAGAFALAASLLVIVGIGVGPWIADTISPPSAEQQALERVEGASDAESASAELTGGGTATAHWSAELGSAVLEVTGLPELSEAETYELWYVRGETPVSAGTFTPDDDQAVAVLDGSMSAGDLIAVTVEPAGGSPTGVPTTDPLFAIATA